MYGTNTAHHRMFESAPYARRITHAPLPRQSPRSGGALVDAQAGRGCIATCHYGLIRVAVVSQPWKLYVCRLRPPHTSAFARSHSKSVSLVRRAKQAFRRAQLRTRALFGTSARLRMALYKVTRGVNVSSGSRRTPPRKRQK